MEGSGLSAVDLIVLTRLDQLLWILQTLFFIFTNQATLMRRSSKGSRFLPISGTGGLFVMKSKWKADFLSTIFKKTFSLVYNKRLVDTNKRSLILKNYWQKSLLLQFLQSDVNKRLLNYAKNVKILDGLGLGREWNVFVYLPQNKITWLNCSSNHSQTDRKNILGC